MTTKQLVDRFNELSAKKIKAWKGKTSDLAVKVAALELTASPAGQAVDALLATSDATKAKELVKKIPKRKVVKIKPKGGKKLGIGAAAYALLGEIKHHENDKGEKLKVAAAGSHPVGFSYSNILKRMQAKFPTSAVDQKHLRWYANKMRELDIFVPVYREKSDWDQEDLHG